MIPFTIVTNNIMYVGVILTKQVKGLYDKNFKSLKKEMEEDLRKWKNLPCSWIGRNNIAKMTIFIILILLIQEHGKSFHVQSPSSISFSRGLKFLSYRSFTCFIRVTPRCEILFWTIVKGVILLISFSSCLSLSRGRLLICLS